jgi:adenylate cyclase
MSRHVALWAILVALPLLGLCLLLWQPALDVQWEHHPGHFWLVLGAALVNGILAFTTGEAAHRRGDARLFYKSRWPGRYPPVAEYPSLPGLPR